MAMFVKMAVIDAVFEGTDFIDYVTVDQVTDTSLKLKIHVNSKISKEQINSNSRYQFELQEKCAVLGSVLKRSISYELSFESKIKSFFRVFR